MSTVPSSLHAARAAAAGAAGARPRAQPLLVRHLMLDPPLMPWHQDPAERHLSRRIGSVWKAASGPMGPAGPVGAEDRLVSMRHFAFQALVLRVEQLVGEPEETPRHAALDLFLSGALDHAYVDGPAFRRLAAEADGNRAGDAAAFLDLSSERVVINTGRCFGEGTAVLAAPATQAVVGMLRARAFGAYLQHRPQLLGSSQRDRQLVACGLGLQAVACCVARAALDEPGLQLTPLAQQLADRAGKTVVAQALLTGALAQTQATVAAFLPLWAQWQQDRRATGLPDIELALAEVTAL
jgi:hypothetical protein